MKLSSHARVGVVGVLNVTPDSFFDGGKHDSVDAARKRATEMIAEGADIIDIGGESTGAGSKDVPFEEELARVLPVVRAIRSDHPDIAISVDTWKADVAEQTLHAGATMINDVTAGRGDPRMFEVVARLGALIVLMYAKDPSARTTIADAQYDDVVETIHRFLSERIALAKKAGVEHIIVDPGLGHFVSSDSSFSFLVLDQLHRFADLGPVLVSPSRKSFLAGPSKLPVKERLAPTIAANCLAACRGASFIRTHDVLETKQALKAIASMVLSTRPGTGAPKNRERALQRTGNGRSKE